MAAPVAPPTTVSLHSAVNWLVKARVCWTQLNLAIRAHVISTRLSCHDHDDLSAVPPDARAAEILAISTCHQTMTRAMMLRDRYSEFDLLVTGLQNAMAEKSAEKSAPKKEETKETKKEPQDAASPAVVDMPAAISRLRHICDSMTALATMLTEARKILHLFSSTHHHHSASPDDSCGVVTAHATCTSLATAVHAHVLVIRRVLHSFIAFSALQGTAKGRSALAPFSHVIDLTEKRIAALTALVV